MTMMSEPEKYAGQEKFDQLREEFPFLEYIGYEATIDEVGLHVNYSFDLSGKFTFRPGFSIPRKKFISNFPTSDSIKNPLFDNILFHIGLIELISYWKAACPLQVIVQGHKLSDDQVSWWKNIY